MFLVHTWRWWPFKDTGCKQSWNQNPFLVFPFWSSAQTGRSRVCEALVELGRFLSLLQVLEGESSNWFSPHVGRVLGCR